MFKISEIHRIMWENVQNLMFRISDIYIILWENVQNLRNT